MRNLLSLTQAWPERSDRELLLDGEVMVDGCHSTDHIVAIQWAFVSLGRAVDRRSFPLVAKERRDFSLACDGVMEEVIWVHSTAGQCQTCCSPTKFCWRDAYKNRELLYWCRL